MPTLKNNGKTPPSAEEINAASLLVLTDGMDARQGVRDALASGSLFDACQGAEVGDLVPYGPQGGEAGVTFPILNEF
jgi:hypothetical protein